MNILYYWDNTYTIKKIKDNSIDLIITDPPYWQSISFNINWIDFNYNKIKEEEKANIKMKFKKKKIKEMKNDNLDDFKKYNWFEQFSNWYRVLKNNSFCFVFWNLESHSFWIEKMKKAWFKFKWYIVWNKKSWIGWDLYWSYKNNTELIAYYSKWRPKIIRPRETEGDNIWQEKKRIWNIWSFGAMNWSIEATWHQTQKPIQLYKKIIEECTNYKILIDEGKKSEIKNIKILDPFSWSGTIFKASHILGTTWIGLEIDDTYKIEMNFRTKDFYTKKIQSYSMDLEKIYTNK